MNSHCCPAMREQVSFQCDMHKDLFECPDVLVAYAARYDEYGLIIRDGGQSVRLISHCPWCGAKLPDSRRDRWFDELEALGFDEPTAQEIPEKYKTDAWYRDA
ncbi:hypothetical protein QTH90_21680 [Variovorax sp. J2P1-59]|uniref:DUF6980 family protein n=1 Tax=Variovorax flavidus TaxID=3053501 RepID=UPI0025788366|nr:hypothetical protein [Variovorax sp. J2P1-59]MDM0077036.1 hypothetical protein [Variovorax sp. J2P1-59]